MACKNSLPPLAPAFFTRPGRVQSRMITTCTATTAAGNPCKNHTVKGTDLCKAHGGSVLDIRHGVKHGRPRLTTKQLLAVLGQKNNLTKDGIFICKIEELIYNKKQY